MEPNRRFGVLSASLAVLIVLAGYPAAANSADRTSATDRPTFAPTTEPLPAVSDALPRLSGLTNESAGGYAAEYVEFALWRGILSQDTTIERVDGVERLSEPTPDI